MDFQQLAMLLAVADYGKRCLVRLKVPLPKSRKCPIIQAKLVNQSRLRDGIGLLKVTMFPGMVGIDVAHEMSRAIDQLHGCRRLIIDLRGNSGGGIRVPAAHELPDVGQTASGI